MKLYVDMPLKMIAIFEKGKRLEKNEKSKQGKYKVIGGGAKESGYADKFNFENEITISRKGSPGLVDFRDFKFWAEEACIIVKPTFMVNQIYLFHHLKIREPYLKSCCYGLIPELDIEKVEEIRIPVPDLDIQNDIVIKLERLTKVHNEHISSLEKEIEEMEKMKKALSDRYFGDMWNERV